jgi:hypothetical protein
MSQPNNQHAAILRQLAESVAFSEYSPETRAAILAGAEALEALAVIADGEGDAQVIARQALARLEGK